MLRPPVISATRLASIGKIGGFTGRFTLLIVYRTAMFRDRGCAGGTLSGALFTYVAVIEELLRRRPQAMLLNEVRRF